ncbi:MAG: translocation/assembly module TamB domain-containing protein [Thermodesulfobacteriota bacterium]|nr:translocation/assembly module TamB domain-containing protein [Thermodesulfobacteriota bacterium]
MTGKNHIKAWAKRLVFILGALALFCALLTGAVLIALQTRAGQRGAAEFVSFAASTDSFRLRLKGLGGSPPWKIRLDGFSLAGKDGVWLTGEDLEIDWKIRDLFFGRLSFSRVYLKSAVFHRVPQTSEADDDKTFSLEHIAWPNLIITEFVIDRVWSAQPLTGLEKSYSLKGNSSFSGLAALIRLEAKGLGESPDYLGLEANLADSPAVLKVKAGLAESPGGLIGQLLGLPQTASIRASLNGTGPVTGWQGRCAASVSGLASLESSLSLSVGDGVRLQGRGGLRTEQGLLPAKAAEYIGREADFQFNVRFTKTGRVILEMLKAETKKARLDLDAEISLAEESLKGSFLLTALDSSVAAAVGLSLEKEIRLKGLISGDIQTPVVEIETSLGAVSHSGVSVRNADLSARLSPAGPLGSGFAGFLSQGAVTLSGLKLPLAGAGPEELQIRFEAETERLGTVHVRRLEINSDSIRAAVSGDLNFEEMGVTSRAGIEILDLKKLEAIHRTGLSGRVWFDLSLEGGLSGRALEAEVRGRARGLGGLPKQAAALTGKDVDFFGKAAMCGGVIDILELKAAGESDLSVRGKVDLNKNRMALTWSLGLPALSALAAPYDLEVKGSAGLKGDVSGALDSFTARAEVSTQGLVIAGQGFSDLTVRVEASGLPADIQGRFAMTGACRHGNISARAGFAVKPDRIMISGLLVDALGANLAGNLALSLKSGLMDGEARLRAGDLSPFADFLGRKLSGSARLNLKLASRQGKQKAQVQGKLINLRAAEVRASAVTLNLETGDLYSLTGGRAGVEIRAAHWGKLALGEAALSLNGDGQKVFFRTQARGALERPFDLRTEGTMSGNKEFRRLVIKTIDGTYGHYPFHLARPVTLEKKADGLRLKDLDLGLAGGRLQGRGRIGEKIVSISFTAAGLPVSLADIISPVRVNGTVGGEIRISGESSRPRLQAALHVSGLKPALPEMDGVHPADADLDIQIIRGILTAGMNVIGLGPGPGSAQVSFPVNFSLRPFSFHAPSSGRISGKMKASFDLSLLQALLALDDQAMAGLAQVDLTAKGSLAAPRTSGRILVSDGRYEHIRLGMIIRDISAEISAGGFKLDLLKATASDGQEGRISATGSIFLDSDKDFPFSAKLNLENARIIRLDEFRAAGSGSLTFRGTASKADLYGKIIFNPVEVNIPQSLPPSLVEVDVTEINAASSAGSLPPGSEGSDFTLNLDVAVEAPARFHVRGQGLYSEWKGALKVTGTSAKPVIRGEFRVIRGRYEFLDRRFNLAQGIMSFGGANPPAPYISVTGETRIKDVTAKVRLSGPAASPQVDLQSDPYLPPDEILALILFGRSLADISPFQALRLAQAAQKLYGGAGSGLDVMGRTRKALGVDQFDIRQGENGGATFGVGKYINEKIYVEAEKGLEAGGDKFSVEVELSPSISLESEVGSNAGGGLRLNWKLDY